LVIASDRQRDFAPIRRQHFVARFFRALASHSVGLTAKIRDERFRLKGDHQAQRAGFWCDIEKLLRNQSPKHIGAAERAP
jgi:hypothetical protein